MKAVVDRIVQYANRYQLTNVETGEVLGTFDFEEVTGTVQQVGTEIDKELFDSIANDLAARVKLSGGELAETIVTFPDISGTAANVASGDTSATLWGKVKNWFSRLKALAFKNKVATGDFEAGAIKNADVAADAAIAQSKVSGLMTDYVASISVSGRTVTYKNKNGVNMGSINTQDTTYELASPSGNGLMSATDKMKLDGIESGAQKNTVLGVKGGSESAYRTGNVNITKENIGLGNVDNTSDEDKPVSAATQMALNGKANTSGSYPDITVGNAEKLGNKAASEYASASDIPDVSNFAEKTGTYSEMSVGNATNATNATNAAKATRDANGNVIDTTYAKLSQVVRVDAAQSLTDAQKQQAQNNIAITVTKETTSSEQVGWWRIAQISRNNVYDIKLKQGYSVNFPAEMNVVASVGYMNDANAVLSLAGGYLPNRFAPSKIRVCGNTTACYIDIYTADAAWNTTVVEIKGGPSSSITQTEFSFIGTSDTVDGYNVVILDLVSGTNTSGGVYQNGAPVFATDPSKLAPSTANGWTQTTATGTLPSAGVYIVAPNASVGSYGMGVMFFDNITSSSAIGASSGPRTLTYVPADSNHWTFCDTDGTVVQLTNVYYKRIA